MHARVYVLYVQVCVYVCDSHGVYRIQYFTKRLQERLANFTCKPLVQMMHGHAHKQIFAIFKLESALS